MAEPRTAELETIEVDGWTPEIVKRPDAAKGFEAEIETAVTWIYSANVKLLTRRIAGE